MASLNRVFLIGNVGRDPEVRFIASGSAVAKFTMATTEVFNSREGGERQEKTVWHNIVVWGRQAEIAGQYIRKGRQLFVEGRITSNDWVDKEGVKHYRTEIVAQRFLLLGRRDEAGGGGGGGYQETGTPGGTDAGGPDFYDIGDLGPPLDMDSSPLSPGD